MSVAQEPNEETEFSKFVKKTFIEKPLSVPIQQDKIEKLNNEIKAAFLCLTHTLKPPAIIQKDLVSKIEQIFSVPVLPENKNQDLTVGIIIKEAITLHELNPDVVEQQLGLPKGILSKLMNDEFYTNSVPVVLFKNLLLSLHIPFEKIERAMLLTFKVVASKETPDTLKKKPHGYMLWENEESVLKYTKHLKELMAGQTVLPISDEEKPNCFYEQSVMNPYPTGSQSATAYKKGFYECFEAMWKPKTIEHWKERATHFEKEFDAANKGIIYLQKKLSQPINTIRDEPENKFKQLYLDACKDIDTLQERIELRDYELEKAINELKSANPVSISDEDIAGEDKELIQVYRRAKDEFKKGNMDAGEQFLQHCRDILGTKNDYLNKK